MNRVIFFHLNANNLHKRLSITKSVKYPEELIVQENPWGRTDTSLSGLLHDHLSYFLL
jgi:hypothetical protein